MKTRSLMSFLKCPYFQATQVAVKYALHNTITIFIVYLQKEDENVSQKRNAEHKHSRHAGSAK